jgi:hypothetical protein
MMKHPSYFYLRCLFLLVNIPLFLSILDRVTPAIAGGSEITPTNNVTSTTPISPTTEPSNLTNPQYQQNGVIFNSDSLNGINSQNCSTGCLQFNVKHSSSLASPNNTEFSIGGLWQLGSPDAAKIDMMKLSTQAALLDVQIRQKRSEEDTTSNLRKELIEAISTRNIHNAILIAKQLAPKLSYTDHWQLLTELGLNRSTIDRLLQQSLATKSPILTVAITRSINY